MSYVVLIKKGTVADRDGCTNESAVDSVCVGDDVVRFNTWNGYSESVAN